MSDDEMRKTMEFILEQQAQTAATVARLSEKVDRTAESVTALLAIAEMHEREIQKNERDIERHDREIAAMREATAEAIRVREEAGRATDERLNALINVVERMISDRQNGKS